MTILTFAGFILALCGVFMAWRAHRKNADLKERIFELNSKIYRVRREMLESQEKTQRELTQLRFDLLKSQGRLKITGDMTVEEVLIAHPQSQQILAGFHIGGCSSCAVDSDQRLDLAVASSGQPIEPVLAALNSLVANGQGDQESTEPLKTPNVQLII